jgi:hydroxyacylglutathione hydrolase
LHTPGHSPGSISLYSAADKSVFVGDVLFRQGVGRTDLRDNQGLPGDWKTLLDSIRNRLLALPDDTIVYPGHGPATTIGHERKSNPFL